jgi:hypothetical protein
VEVFSYPIFNISTINGYLPLTLLTIDWWRYCNHEWSLERHKQEVHKGIIPNAKKNATKGKSGTKSKTKAIGKRKGVPARRKTTNNRKKRRK